MNMATSEWRLGPGGAERYERYKVGRLLGPMAEVFLDQLALPEGARVLDVGCGTGAVARAAARRLRGRGRVVGVDIDRAMLEMASDCAAREGAEIEWLPAAADHLPFPPRSFDLVACQQALQFFPDRVAALREMGRVADASGVVAINLFAAGGAYATALAASLGRRCGPEAAQRCIGAASLGRTEDIAALLERAGLRCLEMRPLSFMRRFEPTQQWLREDSASTPYGADVASLDAFDLAEVVREIADALKPYWDRDCFRLPVPFYVALARPHR